jgi:aminopeptidase C, putative
MNWYLHVLKNYANFEGRARRKEFWIFSLVSLLIHTVLILTEALLIDTGGLFTKIYWLAILLPTLAVSARRLHDTDRSGWWQLLVFIPLIGSIVLLVFYCFDSQPGENRFGSNPKNN